MATVRTAKIPRISMRPTSLLLVLGGGLRLAQTMMAGEQTDKFPPFLYAAEGAQRIIRYGSDGNVAWEYPAEMARDVWRSPSAMNVPLGHGIQRLDIEGKPRK